MRLLMVGRTEIRNKKIFTETHKRAPIDEKHSSKILIDLSHTITDGLVTYKGLPAPVICDFLSRENSRQFYEEGTEFQIGKIEMVTNTGPILTALFIGSKEEWTCRKWVWNAFLSLKPL